MAVMNFVIAIFKVVLSVLFLLMATVAFYEGSIGPAILASIGFAITLVPYSGGASKIRWLAICLLPLFYLYWF